MHQLCSCTNQVDIVNFIVMDIEFGEKKHIV